MLSAPSSPVRSARFPADSTHRDGGAEQRVCCGVQQFPKPYHTLHTGQVVRPCGRISRNSHALQIPQDTVGRPGREIEQNSRVRGRYYWLAICQPTTAERPAETNRRFTLVATEDIGPDEPVAAAVGVLRVAQRCTPDFPETYKTAEVAAELLLACGAALTFPQDEFRISQELLQHLGARIHQDLVVQCTHTAGASMYVSCHAFVCGAVVSCSLVLVCL